MSLGTTGTDMRVPLRGKLMQTGATLGGQFKYVNLFDASGNLIANQLAPATNGITALAGGGQPGATPLTTMLNRVTVVATAADSVMLPASTPGAEITVSNAAAANSLNVFPQAGDAINALAINTALAVAANKTAVFVCMVAGTWHAIVTA